MFTRENYITIPGFAVTDYKLSGNELICFSLVYGFSQDGKTEFDGSLAYLSGAMNITRQNAKAVLDRLLEKGYIEKRVEEKNGVRFCYYKGCCRNNNTVAERVPNNIDNTTSNRELTIFQDIEKEKTNKKESAKRTSEPLCLFANSRFSDIDAFRKEFPADSFPGIDIDYYYHSVADWSASGGKRKRDWIATARNFMRGDKEAGKLKMLVNEGGKKSGLEYLDELVNSL